MAKGIIQTVPGVPFVEGQPIDPHGPVVWAPPGLVQADGDEVSVPYGTGEARVTASTSNWSNFEVWVDLPNSFLTTEFILRLKQGAVTAELDRRLLADIEHMDVYPPDSAAGILGRADFPTIDGRIRGLLFSNYARPAYGELEVWALRQQLEVNGERVNPQGGFVFIRGWGTEGTSMGDRVGRPAVDLWTKRDQQVYFQANDIPVETTVMALGGFRGPNPGSFGPTGEARAVHVTDLTLTGGDFTVSEFILQQREPSTSAVEVHGQFRVSSFGPVVVTWSNPLTGRRGWNWEIARTGPSSAAVAAVLNGFEA